MLLRRITIVIIVALLAGIVIGKIFDYRYKERWNWLFFSKIDEAIKGKKDYDIIFFGNSRVHTGLNPYFIDSVTKMESYNFGIGSGDEQEMKLLSTLYLEHHRPPKTVVIGLDNTMLAKYNILKERFAYLFYLGNDTVNKYMRQNGFPTALIRFAPFTKYSFFDEYNRTSLFIGSGNIDRIFRHNIYKGFFNYFPDLTPDTASISSSEKNKKYFNPLPPPEKINDTAAATFRQTIEMFHAKGTRIIFLYLPERKKTMPQSRYDSFFTGLAKQFTIPILHSDTNNVFTNKYFVTGNHINEPGSEILSLLVADFINSARRD